MDTDRHRLTGRQCVYRRSLRVMNRDNLIKTADRNNLPDRVTERANSKFLPRFIEFLRDDQTDPKPCTADERYALKVQEKGPISRINARLQEALKFIGIASIDTTNGHRNQDPVFPFPRNTHCHWIYPLSRL